MTTSTKPSRRGFLSLSPAERSRIASMGGKAAWRLGTAHRWTPEEAREAGKIGGKIGKGPYQPRGTRSGFREEL